MLKFLMERRDLLINTSKDILSKAENEKRILTEDEKKTVEANAKELKEISSQIEVAKGVAEEEETSSKLSPTTAAQKVRPVVTPGGAPAKKEFENLGEFFHAALNNPNDQRLDYQDYANPRSEQSMGTGSKGGFAIPAQFIPTIKSINPDEAFMRAGATIIPAGDPADAAVTMPALDQEPNAAGTQQVFAGVQVVWTAEGATMTEADANLRDITLQPNEVSGFISLTNKLLRNWGAASTIIETLLRQAINAAEDYAFITGDGVGKPYGIKNHPSSYVQNRNAGGTISFTDFKNMWGRFMGDPNKAIWVCSRSANIPMLSMVGDGGGATNIIGYNAQGQQTVYGAPIQKHGRGLSALGTKGDLILVDRSDYLIKDGSGPLVDSSAHVEWKKNKTLVKIVWNVDGQSWRTKTMKDEAGFEGSPVVVLN